MSRRRNEIYFSKCLHISVDTSTTTTTVTTSTTTTTDTVTTPTSTFASSSSITTGTTSATNTGCLIEENVNYDADPVSPHDGEVDKQDTAGSCQSLCGSNYQDATHFVWLSKSGYVPNGPDKSHYNENHFNTCYCLKSKRNRSKSPGKFAGEVCKGKLFEHCGSTP